MYVLRRWCFVCLRPFTATITGTEKLPKVCPDCEALR